MPEVRCSKCKRVYRHEVPLLVGATIDGKRTMAPPDTNERLWFKDCKHLITEAEVIDA